MSDNKLALFAKNTKDIKSCDFLRFYFKWCISMYVTKGRDYQSKFQELLDEWAILSELERVSLTSRARYELGECNESHVLVNLQEALGGGERIVLHVDLDKE